VVTGVLVPPARSSAAQLRELAAPKGEEDKVTAMLDALDRAVKKEVEDAKIARRSQKPQKYDDPFLSTAELFKKFGFKTCFVNA
jgi:hypothetical protein